MLTWNEITNESENDKQKYRDIKREMQVSDISNKG